MNEFYYADIYDSGLSISEAFERFFNKTLGYATKCGNCTACCRVYKSIRGVKVVDGTTTCSKVKNSGCKIYRRRPNDCSVYSCYPFYMTGVVNTDLIDKNGRLFSFSVLDSHDVALSVLIFIVGKRLMRLQQGGRVIADLSAYMIINAVQNLMSVDEIYSWIMKLSTAKDFVGIDSSNEIISYLSSNKFNFPSDLIEFIDDRLSEAMTKLDGYDYE